MFTYNLYDQTGMRQFQNYNFEEILYYQALNQHGIDSYVEATTFRPSRRQPYVAQC